VITIPAHFSHSQRTDTLLAAKSAGISVLRLLHEPTAAARSILHFRPDVRNDLQLALIYDFGGGTLDVSLLDTRTEPFQIISTAGDPFLGGRNFDSRIESHFIAQFKSRHGIDLACSPEAVERVRGACEKAKIVLTSRSTTKVRVARIHDKLALEGELKRSDFVALCAAEFARCLVPVETVLANAGLSAADITSVVLTGGSSRIPHVQELLKGKFGREPFFNEPRLEVAQGAALLAAQISGGAVAPLGDVCPLSLGVAIGGRCPVALRSDAAQLMTVECVIARGSPIPAVAPLALRTVEFDQGETLLPIYEGESRLAERNRCLGAILVPAAAPPSEPGDVCVDVEFRIDGSGILTVVTVVEGREAVVELAPFQESQERIGEMVSSAEGAAGEEMAEYERRDRVARLSYLCRNIRKYWENAKRSSKFEDAVWKHNRQRLDQMLERFEEPNFVPSEDNIRKLKKRFFKAFAAFQGPRGFPWLDTV
jgi:L1 cell adhesion molecule like protein